MNKFLFLEKTREWITSWIPALGGAMTLALLFLFGLANNMSMSYMGNTSQAVADFILDNFLGLILLFLLKIFFLYLAIGLALGILSHLTLRSLLSLFGRTFAGRRAFLVNGGIVLAVVLAVFFRDIILYPQIYINNFYEKSGIIAFFFELLTHGASPGFFTAILASGAAVSAAIISASALKEKRFRFLGMFCAATIIISISAWAYLASPRLVPASSVTPQRPNILLIGSDALRPDHFSGYGYGRDTTPAIDGLIRGGVSFTNTFIEVPRTFPSWVSILTGRFSATHGIRHMFPTSRDLNREFKSIVFPLREKGYYTAVVGDYAADVFPRIDLGFERVDAPYFNFDMVIRQVILENHTFILPFLTGKAGLDIFPVLRDSAYFCPPYLVRDMVLREINRSGDRPFFITTFFSSTHFPYAPPHPYYLRYAAPEYDGPYKYFKQRVISLEGETGYSKLSGADIRQVRALYDGGLRAFDDSVGDIIDQLKKAGKFDNTIIVILSDHGENLYEGILGMGHGEHFRGHYSTKIPFIIHYPGMSKERKEFSTIARHVDIAPTVMEIAGEKVPSHMEGVSLAPLIRGEKMPPLTAFGETGIWFDNSLRDDLFFQKLRIIYPDITGISEIDFHFDNQIVLNDEFRDIVNLARHRYAYDGRYKLIYMPLNDRVEYELYDTGKDPEELDNIAKRDAYNLNRMKRVLFDWVRRNNDVIIKNDYIFPLLRY